MMLRTWAGTYVDTRMSHDPGRLLWDVCAGWIRAAVSPRWWLARGWRGNYTRPYGARYLH